jgi:predicted glycoside hydrolase/deacetylase ChbG (UPF0249 family)
MAEVPAARESRTRWLIVNSDDFGASNGVNRGVVEAFDRGIVTSASLMVTMPAAEAACILARDRPGLSVGIHVDLTGEGTPPRVDVDDREACHVEIRRQLTEFRRLLGREPSHVDAHHNVFRLEHLTPIFQSVAAELDRPLREHSPVIYFSDFYGQWDDGKSHPEWIGPDNLIEMLAERIGPGTTELSCHPGYVDPALDSSYHADREIELRTLCDIRVRNYIDTSDLVLINYDQLPPPGDLQ